MREIISLHVGQCGIQTGIQMWRQLALEKNIDGQGELVEERRVEAYNCNTKAFFAESPLQSRKYLPRALFIDSDHSCLDGLSTAKHRKLFDEASLIYGDGTPFYSCFGGKSHRAEGLFSQTAEKLRRLLEATEHCEGFMLHGGLSGGTFSSMSRPLLEFLRDECAGLPIMTATFDQHFSCSGEPVCPIGATNTLISRSALRDHSSLSLTSDVLKTYRLIREQTGGAPPGFAGLEDFHALVMSNILASIGSCDAPENTLELLQQEIVRHPEINAFRPILFPLYTQQQADASNEHLGMVDGLLACDPAALLEQRLCSSLILYRGDFVPKYLSVHQECAKVKRLLRGPVNPGNQRPCFHFSIVYEVMKTLPDSYFRSVAKSSMMLHSSFDEKDRLRDLVGCWNHIKSTGSLVDPIDEQDEAQQAAENIQQLMQTYHGLDPED